jgi:glycosyltransferase involved in cell wall biosynthesis
MSSSVDTEREYPLISIGLPTYNGARRIHRALDSIWAQHYPNLDVIICDNCSTDDTGAVCEQVKREHPEVRYYRHKENLGILPNFEFALDQAKGKYFMWLADDDALEPEVLTKYVDFLEQNPEYQLVSGRIRYWKDGKEHHVEMVTLDDDNASRRVVDYYLWVLWGGMFHGFMRTEIAQKVPTRKVYGNDWHYVANIAYLGKIKTLDFVGYNKYLGGSSGDWARYARQLKEPFWVGRFPVVKIAIDAYLELYRSPTFDNMPGTSKFFTAVKSNLVVLYKLLPAAWRHNVSKDNYYVSVQPGRRASGKM